MWRWRGKSDCNMPSAAEVMAASRANLRVCRADGVVVGVRDGVARTWHERLQHAERSGSDGCVPLWVIARAFQDCTLCRSV